MNFNTYRGLGHSCPKFGHSCGYHGSPVDLSGTLLWHVFLAFCFVIFCSMILWPKFVSRRIWHPQTQKKQKAKKCATSLLLEVYKLSKSPNSLIQKYGSSHLAQHPFVCLFLGWATISICSLRWRVASNFSGRL